MLPTRRQVHIDHHLHALANVTLAELLHRAEKSSRPTANLAVVEDFISRLDVLQYTPKAAQHYGQIRTALERAGLPIGVNDLHIAAHARSEGLILVTNNVDEFKRVPALQIENWAEPIGLIRDSIFSSTNSRR